MNRETLTGLLKKGQMILAKAGIRDAGLDAWLLLEYITGKSRAINRIRYRVVADGRATIR